MRTKRRKWGTESEKNLFVLVVAVMLVMAGCGSKPTLEELVESDEVVAGEESANAELAKSGLGLRLKYSADGEDVLVLSYIFEDYQQLAGLDQSDIDARFSGLLSNLSGAANLDGFFKECEETTGTPLKYIRIQIVNADGTVIYSQEYLDTRE